MVSGSFMRNLWRGSHDRWASFSFYDRWQLIYKTRALKLFKVPIQKLKMKRAIFKKWEEPHEQALVANRKVNDLQTADPIWNEKLERRWDTEKNGRALITFETERRPVPVEFPINWSWNSHFLESPLDRDWADEPGASWLFVDYKSLRWRAPGSRSYKNYKHFFFLCHRGSEIQESTANEERRFCPFCGKREEVFPTMFLRL